MNEGQERNDEREELYLTKARLLQGTRCIEEVSTPLGVFRVRPLSEGEKARIEALSVKGIKAKGKREAFANMDLEMEMEQVVANDWEVRFHVLAFGLSVDKANTYTVAEVRSMSLTREIVTQLVLKIRDISGMGRPEDILRRFRSESGGTGPVDPAENGKD